jgi:hypothetical protein
MLKNWFIFICFLTLFGACKKEDPIVPTPIVTTPKPSAIEYFPITDGSYWIYEIYRKKTGETDFKATGILDSTFVAGDIDFLGKKHKNFQSTYGYAVGKIEPNYKLARRDSSDCILIASNKLFCASEFTKPLATYLNYTNNNPKDTTLFTTVTMKKETATVVPSGIYATFVSEFNNNFTSRYNADKIPFTTNYGTAYYVKGIGIIKYVLSGENKKDPAVREEKRLVRYILK